MPFDEMNVHRCNSWNALNYEHGQRGRKNVKDVKLKLSCLPENGFIYPKSYFGGRQRPVFHFLVSVLQDCPQVPWIFHA